ncbi:MAG: 5-formyltetrahydrofolate cyclo-ligase [Thermoplasmatota archaeon]
MEASKAELRSRVGAALSALPPARRAMEEEWVVAAIQADPLWRRSRTLLLYRSKAPEFSTAGLILAAWRHGKRTLFPRVEGESLTLHAAASWGAFAPGYRGILEPPAGVAVPPVEVELALVPGVAFDADGGRLGRGGGHYDRLLAELSSPVWAPAFRAQLLETVPRDAHDRPVTKVWTAPQG